MRDQFKAGPLALVLSLIPAAPVAAGPLQDASAAFDRDDYSTALRLYRSLAEQGDAIAQNNLGVMYYYGKGVPQNFAAALTWYRKAADQGYAIAQNNLSYAVFWVTRRSGGVVCRHVDDLDAVFKSDTCDDLRQLICAFQPPPGLRCGA